jgi:hypothetical protein
MWVIKLSLQRETTLAVVLKFNIAPGLYFALGLCFALTNINLALDLIAPFSLVVIIVVYLGRKQ